MVKYFFINSLSFLFIFASYQPVVKFGQNHEALLMRYMLLNYAYIASQIDQGEGDYLSSLLSELELTEKAKSLQILRNIKEESPDAYSFTKAVLKTFTK